MSGDPLIIPKNAPLDFELCALLGETFGDYIVLLVDGEPWPFFGTPPDSPREREVFAAFVAGLNDRSKASQWPELLNNWWPYIRRHHNLPLETTAKDFHPTFTWKVSRVCAGYSEHLHVAITLFEKLSPRLRSWNLYSGGDGCASVEIYGRDDIVYREAGKSSMARLISLAVKRLLEAAPK